MLTDYIRKQQAANSKQQSQNRRTCETCKHRYYMGFPCENPYCKTYSHWQPITNKEEKTTMEKRCRNCRHSRQNNATGAYCRYGSYGVVNRCKPHRKMWQPIIDKEEKTTMEETKYVQLKTITLSAVNEFACRPEFNKVVKAFGGKYGFTESIPWTKEHEEICENHHSWIADLVKNGFLEKREEELKFDEDKVYCAKSGAPGVCVISLTGDGHTYNTFFIGDAGEKTSTWRYGSEAQRENASFDRTVSRLRSLGYEVKEFSSLREAMEFYHIDGM